MIKDYIVEIIDDCYYPDDSLLTDCDWSLNERKLVDKLEDAINK